MDDDLAFRSIGKPMTLAPGEVVVVLDVELHTDAQGPRHVCVNQRMVRSRVLAHQLHCGPVLLSGFAREIEPRQMREWLWKLRMEMAGQPAVMLCDLRTGTSASGMTEQRQVRPAPEARRFIQDRELAKFHEVVAAPARAQLRPGAVLH